MTERSEPLCAWCGRSIPVLPGPGRPRRYCRRSHRQRAFEARRLARRMGLRGGEAVVPTGALGSVRDRIYVLEAALDDVEADLRGHPDQGEYKRAFQHLYAAAAQLRGAAVEPVAVLHNESSE